MKRLYPLFFAVVLGLLATGCIETQMLVKVDNDGSGTIEERVVMSKMAMGMMKGMMQSMAGDQAEGQNGESGQQPPEELDMFSREKAADKAAGMGSGVRLVSYEKIDDEKGTGYSAVYSFDDINALSVNQDPESAVPEMPGDETETASNDSSGDLQFSFTPGSPARLVIAPPKEEEDSELEEMPDDEFPPDKEEEGSNDLAGMEQMSQFMRGMRMTLAIQVEGSIIETNAQYVDGSKITVMDIDFDKILDNPGMLQKLKKAEEQDPEEVQQLLQGIPGIKFDMAKEIVVTFD